MFLFFLSFFVCPPWRVAPLLEAAYCRHPSLYRRRRAWRSNASATHSWRIDAKQPAAAAARHRLRTLRIACKKTKLLLLVKLISHKSLLNQRIHSNVGSSRCHMFLLEVTYEMPHFKMCTLLLWYAKNLTMVIVLLKRLTCLTHPQSGMSCTFTNHRKSCKICTSPV